MNIDEQFDAMLATIASPSEKLQKKKRKRGRPRAGRVVFSKRQIDSLPQFAHLSEIAHKLGIKHTTIQQWVNEKNPLPFVACDGHKTFRKDVLVKWLVSTRRYVEKIDELPAAAN